MIRMRNITGPWYRTYGSGKRRHMQLQSHNDCLPFLGTHESFFLSITQPVPVRSKFSLLMLKQVCGNCLSCSEILAISPMYHVTRLGELSNCAKKLDTVLKSIQKRRLCRQFHTFGLVRSVMPMVMSVMMRRCQQANQSVRLKFSKGSIRLTDFPPSSCTYYSCTLCSSGHASHM